MRNITKIRRSVRAISPVISVLLMIAIAVVASLVAYAWVMGYMNFQTSKAGQSILIQSYAVSADGTTLYVYVQNNGQGSVVFTPSTCAYINDAAGTNVVVDDTSIDGGQTTLITVSGLSLDITKAVKVKVVTTSGTFAEVKGVPPISGGVSNVPTAYADSYSVVRNTVLTVNAPGVLANDRHVTIAEKVSDPSHGGVVLDAGGSFQYTPVADYVGVDSFTYKASDGTEYSNTVAVTINVVTEPAVLDSFDVVVAEAGDKVQNVPFGITVTAKDQYDTIFTSWADPNTLGASSGSIAPTSTGTFTTGVWSGTVTLSDAGSITITTTGGTKTGTSVPITVLAQYSVNFELDTGGDSMSPSGSNIIYVEGTVVQLSAEALTDYHFTEWTATGSIVITNPTSEDGATATINSAGTITANFEPDSLPDALVSTPELDPASPITLGGSVTATVEVSGTGTTPTGTVTFQSSTDGTTWTTISVETLSGGFATSDPYTPNAAGTNYLIRAQYGGDIHYNGGATSSAASLTVNKADATLSAVTLNPASPIVLGDSVTPSATVSGVSGITPTGTVTFYVSTNSGSSWSTLGTGTLSGGSATCGTSYTPSSVSSNYRFRASYGGDTNYNTIAASGTGTSLTVQAPQVTYVGAGAGVSGTSQRYSATTLNVAYPSDLAADDLLIMQVTVRSTSYAAPTTPSGWTLLSGTPDSSSSTVRQYIYYKFATGSETGSQSISFAATGQYTGYTLMARMYAFRNVALTSFTEGGGVGSGNSATITGQAVTTTGDNRLALAFVFVADNNNVGSFSGGNWAEAAEYQYNGPYSGDDGCIQLQTATMVSAGTISGGSYTMDDSDPWGVRAFALIPRTSLP